jgi:hypothetical protein
MRAAISSSTAAAVNPPEIRTRNPSNINLLALKSVFFDT